MTKELKQDKKEATYHPYPTAKIVCACGNVMKVGSTEKEVRVEICSACHPFYTGSQKFVDTGGRIEKFKKRLAKREEMAKRNVKNRPNEKRIKSNE